MAVPSSRNFDAPAELSPVLESGVDQFLDLGNARKHAKALDQTMSVDGFRSADAPIPLRPVLLERKRYDAVANVARRFVRIMGEVAERRATNHRELAQLVNFRHPPVSLWSNSSRQASWPLLITRPDVGLVDGVPKIFEVNANSAIGGLTQVPRLDSEFLRRPDLRRCWREHPVSSNNVAEVLARALRAVGRSLNIARPRVGVVGFAHHSDTGGNEEAFAGLVDSLCMHGVPAVYVSVQDLRCKRGRAYAGRAELDILLRMFVADDAPAAGIDLEPLRQIIAEDAAILLSPESSGAFASKRVLAWMTQDAEGVSATRSGRHAMSVQDRDFVLRHLPRTHIVEAPGTLGRSRSEVRDYLIRSQTELVLKGNQGHSAASVWVGRECLEDDWAGRVDDALASGDCIVQERIDTDVYELPVWSEKVDRAVQLTTRAVYGPLLLGDECGGILMRHSGVELGDVVSGLTAGFVNTALAVESHW